MSLREVYDHLYRVHGPQSWWPAKTPFEVMVGAVLTQNTAWTNVEKAIANLHGAEAMEAERLLAAPAAPGNRATARGSLERQGHRPRNRGRHPALRVSPPGVRDRCVHPPHPYTARSRAR